MEPKRAGLARGIDVKGCDLRPQDFWWSVWAPRMRSPWLSKPFRPLLGSSRCLSACFSVRFQLLNAPGAVDAAHLPGPHPVKFAATGPGLRAARPGGPHAGCAPGGHQRRPVAGDHPPRAAQPTAAGQVRLRDVLPAGGGGEA